MKYRFNDCRELEIESKDSLMGIAGQKQYADFRSELGWTRRGRYCRLGSQNGDPIQRNFIALPGKSPSALRKDGEPSLFDIPCMVGS